MKGAQLFCIILLLNAWFVTITAQDMEQLVTLRYHGQPLSEVLIDISTKYEIQFTYSRDFIPVDHPIEVEVEDCPLFRALEIIFEPTPIIYKNIAGNIVLKVDSGRQLSQVQKSPVPSNESRRKRRLKESKPAKSIPSRDKQIEPMPGGERMVEFDPDRFSIPETTSEVEENDPLLQVALFSMKRDWDEMEEVKEGRVMIDVLGGNHSKVNGVNIGGGFNNIHHSVKGVQFGGLGNRVREDVSGIQAAGLFNKVNGRVTGLQVAGIYNKSGSDLLGIQLAGGVNIANKKADAVQFAGLVNYAGSNVKNQLAGVANIAGDVSWSQTSGLFNKANEVKGFQLGLINVADTVALGSYGLLNFIKRGYNRVELSGSEVLHTNLSFKLGTKQFYNIFHFGVRWDEFKTGDQQGIFMSWGLGYGLGTTITVSPRSLFNLEAVVIHLNELEAWTNELNLLNQLRFTYDIKLNNRLSLFAGPVANIYVTKADNSTDPIKRTAHFVPYTIVDGRDADNDVKMWLGINAGFRF
jgi:hypothetical protein